jgi:hypothetical protein
VSGRRARLALGALVVGLAVHNLVLAELWDAGLRGGGLDVVAAWKEALLLAALAAAAWSARRLPPLVAADVLSLVYAGLVVLYALLPQHWLDGGATARGVLYALRHDLVPVAAYWLGRLAVLGARDRRALGWLAVAVAAAASLWGLVDVYAVPLQWWRDSGVPGWFRQQLSLDYGPGLSHLPENWVYNTGDEESPLRRLVSTFLSPLAASYLTVVALLFLASRRRLSALPAAAALACFAGLLWTHTRAATLALPLGLLVLAAVQRRWLPVAAAAVTVAVSVGFFAAYPSIGPTTSYTASELAFLRQHAHEAGPASGDAFSAGESSLSSHWRNLRDGIRTVVHHPQGYGLGNAGTEAKRTDVTILAGESTYTELGVEAGLAGAVAFAAWGLALVAGTWRRSAWLAAALAAVLALAVQTDVLGVPWLAYVLFALAGSCVAAERARSA